MQVARIPERPVYRAVRAACYKPNCAVPIIEESQRLALLKQVAARAGSRVVIEDTKAVVDAVRLACGDAFTYHVCDSNVPIATCETHPFNGDPIVGEEVAYLAQLSGARVLIETGTFLGNTTVEFARLFQQVHTIEYMSSSYEYARERLALYPNVHCYLGNSVDVLPTILNELKNEDMIMVYLDAHWHTDPLQGEILLLGQTFADRVVIIIDDVVVPGDPFFTNDGITLEGVQNQLAQAYPSGYHHYYIGRTKHVTGRPVGKLYIVPKCLGQPHSQIVNGIPRSTI
jgi:predicted O-methyltransferase YrrM